MGILGLRVFHWYLQDITRYHMVVRTPGNPGKPGIHLEFENSTWNTWKTWNLYEKSLKIPGI